MRVKTRITTTILALVVVSNQFNACKKDEGARSEANNSASVSNANENTEIDSTLMNGLVAWYTFDGDVLDHSGHNNNIVFNSATPAKGQAGIPKTAYLFDGAGSYMQVANSTSLNPQKITLYAVVKLKGFWGGTCHDNRVISKGYNDTWNGRYTLGYNDQAFYNYAGCFDTVATKNQNFVGSFGDGQGTASGVVDNLENVKLGRWYSIAYTYNGTYSKFYVNGILRAQALKTTSFTPSTQDIFIGRNEDPAYPYYFNGLIDEIRIYRKALSAGEVSLLYNNSSR